MNKKPLGSDASRVFLYSALSSSNDSVFAKNEITLALCDEDEQRRLLRVLRGRAA